MEKFDKDGDGKLNDEEESTNGLRKPGEGEKERNPEGKERRWQRQG